MNFYKNQHKYYCGIDLLKNNQINQLSPIDAYPPWAGLVQIIDPAYCGVRLALTLTTEDKRQNQRVVCQEI
jgi:hypothetical protein